MWVFPVEEIWLPADNLKGMEQSFDTQPRFEVNDPSTRIAVQPPRSSRRLRREKSVFREYAETITIALLAAVLIRMFIISAYHVSSGSMEDTLREGDYIFVYKLAYQSSSPKAGDVIVFQNPVEPTKDYIKRVVAVGGQTVEIVDKVVLVNGAVAPIPGESKNTDQRVMAAELSPRDNFGPFTVPQGQYFVMGDNRDDSQDSRFWGCVDKSYIKGKAIFVYFSYEPDPTAPQWKSPYVLESFQILWHNLFSFSRRVRFDRMGQTL